MTAFLQIQVVYWAIWLLLNIVLRMVTKMGELEITIISSATAIVGAIIGLFASIKSGNSKLVGFKGDLSKENSELKHTFSKEHGDLSKEHLKIIHQQEFIAHNQKDTANKMNFVYNELYENKLRIKNLSLERENVDKDISFLLHDWKRVISENAELAKENELLVKQNESLKEEISRYKQANRTHMPRI